MDNPPKKKGKKELSTPEIVAKLSARPGSLGAMFAPILTPRKPTTRAIEEAKKKSGQNEGMNERPMTRDEFINDITALPANISEGALLFFKKTGWRFMDEEIPFNPNLRRAKPPNEKWRKRATGQPERVQLLNEKGTACGIFVYKATGRGVASFEIYEHAVD